MREIEVVMLRQMPDAGDEGLIKRAIAGPFGKHCVDCRVVDHGGSAACPERGLSASSIIVTVSALRFFYTVTLKRRWAVEDIPTSRKAKKLPVVLGQDEVARFLGAVDNLKHRMILTVCSATSARRSVIGMARRCLRHSGTP
jgi:hypothetical protein